MQCIFFPCPVGDLRGRSYLAGRDGPADYIIIDSVAKLFSSQCPEEEPIFPLETLIYVRYSSEGKGKDRHGKNRVAF